jgi:hypothetical protein
MRGMPGNKADGEESAKRKASMTACRSFPVATRAAGGLFVYFHEHSR